VSEKRPVIGVTSCGKLEDYVKAVEQAGGQPRVLEVGQSPRDVIGTLDGLLLTGGGDVDPAWYGEDRHPSLHDAEPGRDEFEMDLARRAVDADLPVLAICRGAQVLNVASGGSLVQDIPSSVQTDLPHTIQQPQDAVAHDVQVVPGSRLEQALGPAVADGQRCRVNSRHHQALKTLGRDLVVSATAPDGIVEGIEVPSKHFCIGVQWHPENFWRTGEFSPLFDAFLAAARERTPSRG
jgi:putative glutamine amidotransferase